jgi:hypothetical protein
LRAPGCVPVFGSQTWRSLLGKLTTPLVGRVVKRDVDNLY